MSSETGKCISQYGYALVNDGLTGDAVNADTLQTYAWNAYAGAPGTATHMALWITGTGELDDDIAAYQTDIGGICSYTPHLDGQAVPEGVFNLELSFHCHQSSRSPRGTPIEYANERYTRLALTVREENRPPAITAVLPESDTMDTVAEGDLWRFAVTALDPDDGDTLSYSWHYSLDGGVSWNLTPHAEPEITDLVPFEAVQHPAAILGGGQLQMRVTVSDNKGAQDSHTWTAMHVHDRNRRPEARPPGEPAAWGWLTGGSTGQPPASYWSAAVWTGNRMIVWGGYGSATILNTGGRYDPLTGTWQSTSTQNAPSARFGHGAVWTGAKLLVWGGNSGHPDYQVIQAGAEFSPAPAAAIEPAAPVTGDALACTVADDVTDPDFQNSLPRGK